jgi:glyoxylase-like metal-dependent hydrolase (beta-lactamase superfamily II)
VRARLRSLLAAVQTKRVTDNITQLTRYHFVNAFLVREDDGLTLVDTGMGGERTAAELIAAASADPIRRIALTHGHGDHVGSLDALKDRLGETVEVLMPELDARIHAGEHVVDGKLPGSWPTLRTRPDTLLRPGRPCRQPRSGREPGSHAGPRVLPRHARPDADRRRRVHGLRPGVRH